MTFWQFRIIYRKKTLFDSKHSTEYTIMSHRTEALIKGGEEKEKKHPITGKRMYPKEAKVIPYT